MSKPRLVWSSERSAHVVLGEGDDDAQAQCIVDAYAALRAAALPGVVDLTPASTAIQITLDPLAADPEGIASAALAISRGSLATAGIAPTPRLVTIPVCYDPAIALDLAELAASAGMTADEAAALHANAEYTVRFLGFAPGFAYMAGLPAPLHAPRLPSPRARVPAGSVGIAGARTGIYPHASPGGWRIVGATPLRLFDAKRESAATLRAGDRVRFHAISLAEYRAAADAERAE